MRIPSRTSSLLDRKAKDPMDELHEQRGGLRGACCRDGEQRGGRLRALICREGRRVSCRTLGCEGPEDASSGTTVFQLEPVCQYPSVLWPAQPGHAAEVPEMRWAYGHEGSV